MAGSENRTKAPGEGSYSKANTTNPKDLFGLKKVSITKVPMVALLHLAHAMMNGASKYGPYNWRAKKVIASIYVDAAMRHLAAFLEGEETAQDSGVHHLGHAMACCAILLDAQETGNLVDDRPTVDAEMIGRLMARLQQAMEKWHVYDEGSGFREVGANSTGSAVGHTATGAPCQGRY